MKTSKLVRIVLVFSLTCAMLLTACSSSPQSGSAPGTSAPPQATSAPSATSSAPAEKEYVYPVMKLTINDYNVANSGPALGTEKAAKYIEEKSGGNITCDVYVGGTLMESTDVFNGTVDGMADISYYLLGLNSGVQTVALLLTTYYTQEMPNQDGLFEIYKEAINTIPDFRAELSKQGLYLVGLFATPHSYMVFHDDYAKKVNTPDDLKGKLIQSSGYNTLSWANHGVSGMNMPPSEWYTNLERGVVDALTLNMPCFADFGLTEIIGSYVSFGNTGGLYNGGGSYIANLEKWNSWDPEVQQLITEAFGVACQFITERDLAKQEEVKKSEFAAKPVHYIPQEAMQPWYDLGMESVGAWKKEANALGYNADAIYEAYSKIITNYMATH